MKILKFLPALLMAVPVLFTACSDDEKKEKDVYSELTVEAHKENVEAEAVGLANQMEAVGDMQTFDVMKTFSENMESSDLFSEEGANKVVSGINKVMAEVASVKSPKSGLSLKSLAVEDESVTAMFAEYAGIYTWNGTDWEKEASSTEMTFKFQVEGKGAEIGISKFEFVTATNQTVDEFKLELPTDIKMGISYDSNVLCSFSFEGEYAEDDMPESLVEKITLEGFTLESSLKLTKNTKVKTDVSFDYNGDVIYSSGFEVNGEFNFDDIYDTVEGDTNEEGPMAAAEIVENASAYFQLGNIKADASVDFEGMINAMEKAEEQTQEAFLKILNDNAQGFVRYADTKEVIAKTEFYFYTDEYGEEEMSMKMVFADGTSVDDSFWTNGFEDFKTQVNDIITELNEKYDLDLELVE